MDPIHAVFKWLSHNRYLALGLAASAGVLVYVAGCESTTLALDGGTAMVPRSQFQAQASKVNADMSAERARIEAMIAAFNAKVEATNAAITAGAEDLDKKDAIRAQIVSTITGLIPGLAAGKFDVAQLLGTGVGLVGLLGGAGAVADNRRKNAVIASLKAPSA